MAEWALGRSTRKGTVGALTASLRRPGRGLAWLLLFGLAMALSYYTVIIANVAFVAGFAAVLGFSDASRESFAAGLVNGFCWFLLCSLRIPLRFHCYPLGFPYPLEFCNADYCNAGINATRELYNNLEFGSDAKSCCCKVSQNSVGSYARSA